MPRETLTNAFCKRIKPTDRKIEYCDDEPAYSGLRLIVRPSGRKTFAYRSHSYQVIGDYPATLVANARKQVALWKLELNAGQDPFIRIKASKAAMREARATDVPTYAQAWADYRERHLADKSPSYRYGSDRSIRKHFLSGFGKRELGSLTQREWVGFREKQDTARPAEMSLMQRYISTWHHWMAETSAYMDFISGPPVMGTVSYKTKVRTRKLTSHSDIRRYWQALHEFDGPRATMLALQFLFLSNKRGIEVRRMTIDLIDFERGIWTIPGEMNKSKREVRQPLTPLMREIIRKAMGNRDSGYVFQNGVSQVMVSINVTPMLQKIAALAGTDYISIHDYRRTVSSGLEDMGIPARVISLTEGHFDQGIEVHYQQGGVRKLDDMLEAYVAWQAFLEAR